MKKILSLLLVFLCSWASAFAQSAEIYSSGDLKAKPGDKIELSLSMKNEIEIKAWSFRLVLPEGVTVEKDSRGRYVYELSRTDEHSKDAQNTSDEPFGVQFSVYGNYPFLDNDGTIISLNLLVSENVDLGNKEIRLAKINYANMEDKSVYQDDLIIPLKIYNNFSVSATSTNETMGSVTIDPSGDEIESGTSITATATANDGYSFVNWTAGETVVSAENPYTFELAAATTLTANFQANQYPVVFKNDGKEVKNETIDFASVITAPANPTKEGYTFKGWFAGETQFVEGATVPVGGITYEATWQINQYTITFDTDGGSEVASITQDYESAIIAPENPTKTGYTFKAWEPVLPETMPVGGLQTKATWTINQYTVKFVADDVVVSEEKLDYGSAITAPEIPAKEGYTGAWDKTLAETVPAEDVTYTAVYTPIDYTITFDTDGGSVVETITLPYGSAIVAPENPTKTGYTFAGWDPTLPETMPVNGFQTKATWTINQYTVKFVADDVVVSVETLDYGSAITAPEIPAKEGYTGAWDKVVAETVPAEDVTYTAVYTPIKYTVTFNTDGGTEIAPIKVAYGSAITLPEDPTKEGYTFKEWENVPATMPANDVELKAIWTINNYNVTFDFGFNGLVDTKEYEYNEEIVIPDVPSRAGWIFLGWDPEVDATVPAHNVTYSAQWKQDIIALRFVFWDGYYKEYQYKPGEEITERPNVPEREGYTFLGWDKPVPDVMPEDVENGILTITAKWKTNIYIVYFSANDQTISKQELPYGSTIVVPEAPEVEGYTFVGWTPEVAQTVPAKNVWYEAVYEINTYKVTYYLNDEVVNVAEVKYGEAIPAYEPTVEEGMKFDGWQEEIPAVMPANDLEIHGTTSGIETAIKNIVAKFGETFDVYNVSGRLVQRVNSASDISRIPAGMYIINGTKVVIRKD